MKIVIIGAGPAGVSAVETIRAHDRQSEIQMLSSEPFPPYSPPAMADHFIHGSNAHLWRGQDWPEALGVDYKSGSAVIGVDVENHLLRLADGGNIDYDRLVIATGSRLYAPVEGAELPGVYNFKSLSAAQTLIERVKSGEAQQALIVGAGFIGMEIALLLRKLGVAVTQVEMTEQVMPAMLDMDTARLTLKFMQQKGVEVSLNTKAVAFVGNGKAEGVRLESGESLYADVLIAATGVRPNLEFLEGSGIAHGWGITVDESLRTTQSDIYAAGDVVEVPDLLTGETYVHAIFLNAVEQGNVVGLNILGFDSRYDGAHRMNSLKHLDLPIMAAGLKTGDEVLQTKRNGSLRTVYLQENQVVGFQMVGDIKSAGVLRALMNNRQNVAGFKDKLLDSTFGQGTIIWQAMAPWV
jgi:nitrite reductase (NADH) large subunit